MVRLAVFVSVACLFGVFASVASATTPHATARTLLTRCKKAVNAVPIVALRANTPQVPQANRRAQAAFHKCGTDGPWLKLKSDKAIRDARTAWADLTFGIGDYMTYCENVAFGHTGKSILYKAQREIRRGRMEARHALAEL